MSLTYDPRLEEIENIPIADGLKKLLIDYGLTTERLTNLSPQSIASILGIDEYIAKIIHYAAKNKNEEGLSWE